MRTAFLFSFLLLCLPAGAAEGKWTPLQLSQLDPAWLKQLGLQIPPAKLWDPATNSGLLSAVINTGGCTGTFVSPEGLFLTNHHCLFNVIQEHSTPQRDLIKNGFVAATREEELASRSSRVTIPRKFTEVTSQVRGAIPQGADDLTRFRAIEQKQKELARACEAQASNLRCRVAAFDGGLQYVLVEAQEVTDIRLVYAPPRSIGEYGGEVDNFAWPRHTGDFSMGRAYVDGKPLATPQYLPLAKEGAKPGDFVMVLGYPGTTFRALTAAEMEERRDLFFARRIEILGAWIRIMEETSQQDPTAAIAVASNLKSLLNVYKNAQGQIEGFRRGNLLEKQRAAELQVVNWAEQKPEYRFAIEARRQLIDLVEEQKKTWERDFLVSLIPRGSVALAMAAQMARIASERQKPEAERDPEYRESLLPQLRARMEREQKDIHLETEQRLFLDFVQRALKLPAEQRIGAVDEAFRSTIVKSHAASLIRQTKVLNLDERKKMFEETPAQLAARQDGLLDLGLALEKARQEAKNQADTWNGRITRLRPLWRTAVQAHAGKPVSPDANSTLRLSFAQVKGYDPRDGVTYRPQTTLAGLLEKHTGQEPFALLPDWLARARQAPADLPVNFLSDADTSGGNSGSPALNGKGELVGVNFDRVWENVANDFGYNPAIARNINADVRYLRWLLQQAGAAAILKELSLE